MSQAVAGLVYLVAALCFIVGLKQLTSPVSARRGNRLAAVGMFLAVVVTLLDRGIIGFWGIGLGVAVGTVVGVVAARRVAMTDMPQLVALFNGFGGGASALVAVAELMGSSPSPPRTLVAVALSTAIGAITFSGSLVAFSKLQGLVSGRALRIPGQTAIDGGLAVVAVGASGWLIAGGGVPAVLSITLATLALGVTRVLPIGGADMPVVISFLNAASGLAASTTGFVIESNALIISGALVGAAGLILTFIMCRGMNRSLGDVLFGVFGAGDDDADGDAGDRVARRASPEDVAIMAGYADRIVVVPGYGMAVAQAQHTVQELTDLLEDRGVEVSFAIHPVAGRMPGHMNVLLAEANVPYDKLVDLDDINGDFAATDLTIVVGANDVVNPSARDDPTSPIYGMPILEVDRSRTVVVVKRSLSPGFAGIDNPLFYQDSTSMLFADARAGLADVITALKDLG